MRLRVKDADYDEGGNVTKQAEIEQGVYYPFKIIFPINKVRVYYCRTK